MATNEQLIRGLYELLLNRGLEEAIAALDDHLLHEEKPLHEAEAADRIALYVGNALRHAIELPPQARRVSVGLALADTLMGPRTTQATAITWLSRCPHRDPCYRLSVRETSMDRLKG